MSCKYNNCKLCGYKSECEIYKENAELKAYNEKLLNGDIEKHNKIVKLQKENEDLKRDKEDLIFIRNQKAKCICEDKERLTYAKTIIQDLLNNSDEYAKQRAIDFLGELDETIRV